MNAFHTHLYFRLLSSQEEVYFFDPACVLGHSSFKYSSQGQKERAFDVHIMLSSCTLSISECLLSLMLNSQC